MTQFGLGSVSILKNVEYDSNTTTKNLNLISDYCLKMHDDLTIGSDYNIKTCDIIQTSVFRLVT